MARRHFGDINAVGRRFRIDQVPEWIEVVGVVRDTGGSDQPEVFFHSIEQADVPGVVASDGRTVAARTSGDASALVRELQRELLAIDPSLPVFSARTMAQRREQELAGPNAVALSLGVLGGLGLVLAGVGLYAVIAFAVSRRAREIGIRMALGAGSSAVVGDVARDVAMVLGAGAGLGLMFALLVILGLRASSDTSAGMVNIDFHPPGVDPLQLAAIAAFLLVVGVSAAFVPARRASRMNPLAALRHE
jgi:predicted lysophospholipase L1 biosynthesis ABC-type transport system permease subunit